MPAKKKPPTKPKRPLGRPTKFDAEGAALIVELVGNGNFRETAAAAAGIDAHTLRNWMKLGADGVAPFADFARSLNRAAATAETSAVTRLKTAGEADWKADSWRLERQYPRRWGQRIRLEVDNALRDFMGALATQLDPKVFDEVLRIASEFDCAGDEGGESGSH